MADDDSGMYFAAAAAGLRYNSPLGEGRVTDLVRRLTPTGAGWRALDLGCGNGEMLMRLARSYDIAGVGVERDPDDGERARKRATELGLAEKVTFHTGNAADWDEPAELVVNVGAGYVWGDTGDALAALHRLTKPGGRLLFADAFYQTDPGDRLRETFGDLPDLASLAQSAVDAGFRPLHIAESTLAEWDDFESDWRAHIEDLGTPEARAFADQRRIGYLTGYRGVVGFGWLVLTPA
ncbi:methyltransferase domain-containing protein [Actinoplanes sp. NEAU-A12]|uniref:Methyltransferase domain-containing protein n=1 Tax=Actinoplanes sandaracinus TaxID=3045177 RepID=A0ABT6X185_9ACTN|nr:methyltransferase domain-containing protein [Actinoplanes sandaracinus]MDI6105738.1 methyltransferase domain-containing protein [Actinoplanes sandaracinus]